MRRRHFLQAAAGSAALLAAPRLGHAEDTQVLRFVPYADVAIIDPIWTAAYATRTHALLVWDTLYGLDEHFQPHPQMVEGHVMEADGKRWTLTLRDGLVFHDGTKVLARDCVASLKRWGVRDAFGQALMAATDELSAPDDKTIVFRLNQPFPLLPNALARPSSLIPVIMPERLAKTDAYTQVSEAIGSGPFRYVASERVPGARHVYAKHEKYLPREGTASFTAGPRRAFFERVEFNVIPDPATSAAALQSGSVDWVEQPLIDLLPVLRRNRDVVVEVMDSTGMFGMLRLNHLQAPFNNPGVRRVVLKALNQHDCMAAVAGAEPSLLKTGIGFFPAGSAMASDAGLAALQGSTKPDYAALKKELAEAGYKGEKVVLLAGQDVPRISAVAEVAASMFQSLGMNLDFVPCDWGTVNQRIPSRKSTDEGGWSAYAVYWSGLDLATPASNSPLRANGAKASAGWPDDPKLEALRAQWMSAGDLKQQQAIARDIQLEAIQAVPYVPAGQYLQPVAYRKNLTGMLKGVPVFTNIRRA